MHWLTLDSQEPSAQTAITLMRLFVFVVGLVF